MLIEVPDALLAGVRDQGGLGVDAGAVPRNVDAVKPRLIERIKRFDKNDVFTGGLSLMRGERARRKNRRRTRHHHAKSRYAETSSLSLSRGGRREQAAKAPAGLMTFPAMFS